MKSHDVGYFRQRAEQEAAMAAAATDAAVRLVHETIAVAYREKITQFCADVVVPSDEALEGSKQLGGGVFVQSSPIHGLEGRP